ncbi:hypothetical protein ABTY96_07120 [Streptomyces sp. NPDC096057]|uniref:hypothetical protein n=1 Tax=Streptomyces sp. NPDC096057 TaxID=3155543 RepID=UPI003330018F
MQCTPSKRGALLLIPPASGSRPTMIPLGTMADGALGTVLGLRETLWVVSGAMLFGSLAIICSPPPPQAGAVD